MPRRRIMSRQDKTNFVRIGSRHLTSTESQDENLKLMLKFYHLTNSILRKRMFYTMTSRIIIINPLPCLLQVACCLYSTIFWVYFNNCPVLPLARIVNIQFRERIFKRILLTSFQSGFQPVLLF